MNPAILLIGALVLIYAGATGRAEAVWKALSDPTGSGASTSSTTKTKSTGSGDDNPATGPNVTGKP